MESGEHTAAIVCVLVIAGMLLGISVGRCGESGTEVLVRTTTVKSTGAPPTKTVTVARTKTVTAPVDTLADTVEEEDVPATGTTDPGATDSTENCSPDYLGACVPLDATDVTCSDISERRFDSVGNDPYGLDPDGDSFACES